MINNHNSKEMKQKNIGSVFALYPSLVERLADAWGDWEHTME